MASPHDVLGLGRCGGSVVQHLRDTFHLPALGGSVAKARRRVLTQLREWGMDEGVRGDAELVVSELFTNAVQHTDSVKVSCELRVIGARLRVEVADQGRAEANPRARSADVGEEGGRGLLLVGALSDDWGVRPDGNGRGQIVWADLLYGTLRSR